MNEQPHIGQRSGVFQRRKGFYKDGEGDRLLDGEKRLPAPQSTTCYVFTVGIAVLVIAGVAVVHITTAASDAVMRAEPPDSEEELPPSPSVLRRFARGAVCSDGAPCSDIGREILLKNGSAVDAALATLFCNGLINCHSMGLSGGFFMTVYDNQHKQALYLNARETAPAGATQDMFRANPNASRAGPLAVAVPGELAGYWEAHQKFGKLPWAQLVEPAIRICHSGYNMTKHQYDSLFYRKELIIKDPLLRQLFVDPATETFYRPGRRILQAQYCKTLEVVAREGANGFYNGSLGRAMVQDIKEMGGIVTMEDLRGYKAQWEPPIVATLASGDTVVSAPPPGSGALLAFILNLLEEYKFTSADVATVEGAIRTYHLMVETFKFAYAKRTELGDPRFVDIEQVVKNLTSKEYARDLMRRIDETVTSNEPSHYGAVYYSQEDHGTAHVSIISPQGDAVSVTSTINLYFGAGITSKRTGIVLNSGMDDFSSPYYSNYFNLPGSPANSMEPGKRPLSSMCPTIVINPHGEVKLVIGAAGGTTITTGVAFVMMRHLWLGEDIKKSIDASRLHHQLFPMQISYEYGLLKQIVTGLERLGHKMTRYRDRGSVICAIAKVGDYFLANADYRKASDVNGID